MPNRDHGVTSSNSKKTGKDQGRLVVTYISAAGKRMNAYVVAAGSVSGLKLQLYSPKAQVDNVPVVTNSVRPTGPASIARW